MIILLNLLGRKNYISVERDHHFGGFYFDLDLLLASRLDELTVHACVFPFERLTWTRIAITPGPASNRLTCACSFTAGNMKTGLFFLSLIAAVFLGCRLLPPLPATVLGTLATFVSGAYSIRVLLALVSLERVPPRLQRLLIRTRLARSVSN